jgi:hypothetical protein
MQHAEMVWKDAIREQGELNCGFAKNKCRSYILLKQKELVV